MAASFLFLLFSIIYSANSYSDITIIKPDFQSEIHLNIIRAYPDSFETYTLIHNNSREMTLVCAHNSIYRFNKKAMIEFRNFYNEIAGYFTVDDNKACLDMARFIEGNHMGITEDNPFRLVLDRHKMSVTKIQYPNLDPFSLGGNIIDLLPKKEIKIKVKEKSRISIGLN